MTTSANAITAFNPAFWAREMQGVFQRDNVAIALANTELRDQLPSGTIIHKPYRGTLVAQTYVKGTDISTFNDLSSTDEYLTVDTTKVVPFYVDELDRMENKWDAAAVFAQDAQKVLNNLLDQAVLAKYSDARTSITSQDLGGSGTGSATVNAANIANLFAVAARKLQDADVPGNDLCAIIGPRLLETLRVSVAGRETGFGDTVGDNGKISNRFGFGLYFSNNIPFSALVTYGGTTNNPTDGDYIKIGDIKFTFKSTLTTDPATVAGEIKIESTAAATFVNLAACINSATVSAAAYTQISTANRRKLIKGSITATNSAPTVTIAGYGDVPVQEYDSAGTLGAATNIAVTSNAQYPLFMKRGAIDLVVPKSPNVEFRMAEVRLGRFVYPWMNYGVYTFDQMKDAMTYGNIDTSSWV